MQTFIKLYDQESYDGKRNAQLNLAGRTHFVDDDTLRYFRSRILASNHHDNGLLFSLIESCSGDYEHKTRVFRYAIFDVFGHCVDRPDLAHGFKSTEAARKALYVALNAIDAIALTRAAIEREMAAYASEMHRFAAYVDAIDAKQAA